MDLQINSKSLTELDIAEVVITYINQGVDSAKITLNADSIADIPPEIKPGAQCVFAYGQGRFVFWGKILIPEESATGGEQQVVLYAESTEGRLLRDTMRTNAMPAWNGSSVIAHVVEKVILQGTLYQVLVDAVQQVCVLGSVDLPTNIPFPTEEHTNISCLDVIRRVLSYVPGAQMWFDYSGWRPRFNVAKADSVNLRTSTPTDYVSHGLKLLNSNKLKQVRFSYIRPGKLYGPPTSASQGPDVAPLDMVKLSGTDASTVIPVAEDVLFRTIELPGSVDFYTTNMAYNPASLWSIIYEKFGNETRFEQFWARYGVYDFNPSFFSITETSVTVENWLSDPYWQASKFINGQINWFTEIFNPSTGNTWRPYEQLYYRAVDYPSGIPFLRGTLTVKGTDYRGQAKVYTASGINLTTMRYPYGSRLSRTINNGDTTTPVGVAQEIQNSFNRDQYEGAITLDHPTDVSEQFDLSRGNLQLSGVSIGGVSRREYVASTDTFRLTFGPPRHLSPSEHIRHKMFRPKN